MTVTRSDQQRLASLISSRVDLAALACNAGELMPMSSVVGRLAVALENPDWDPSDIVEIVRVDPGLTARLLRSANSAAFGGQTEIGTIEQALMRVGPGTAVALAVGGAVRGPMQAAIPMFGLGAGDLWRHSIACALATEESGRSCGVTLLPEAYAAALLHDVGKVVLATACDDATLQGLVDGAGTLGYSECEARTLVLGLCHAELGGLLITTWGLPESISDAVRYHHAPLMAGAPETRRLCSQLQLADAVATLVNAPCDHVAVPTFNPALAGTLQISQRAFEKLVTRVSDRLDDVIELYG